MEQNHKEIFHQLVEEARKQIPIHPEAEQVAVLRTKKNQVYCLALPDAVNAQKELEGFFGMLREKDDCRVSHVVAMWSTGGAEIPSFAFRKGLLELDAANGETLLLLAQKPSLLYKTLQWSMPG